MGRLMLVVAVSALLLLGVSAAQNDWTNQAQKYMQGSAGVLIPEEYSLAKVRTGMLGEGESDLIQVVLNGQRSYMFLGACDDDCTDVDIEVFDGDTLLVGDVQTDDIPLVSVKSGAAGVHTVRLTMAKCSAGTCAWALGTYIE